MPAITANTVIQAAFSRLNVYLPTETPSAANANFALGELNRMVGGWSQRGALMIPVVARETFDLTANKGGPSNPYTIGTGGNFNTPRPPNQHSVTAASLILTDSDPDVEIPLGIYTDDAYNAVAIKELTSAQPTGLYYNPTYTTTELGTINLWPVPDNATNDLALYLQKPLTRFAALATSYYVPEGVDDALVYNLERRLAGPFGRILSADDQALAVSSLSVVKRSNVKLSDLATDAIWATMGGRRTLYNIQTDGGG